MKKSIITATLFAAVALARAEEFDAKQAVTNTPVELKTYGKLWSENIQIVSPRPDAPAQLSVVVTWFRGSVTNGTVEMSEKRQQFYVEDIYEVAKTNASLATALQKVKVAVRDLMTERGLAQ